MLLTVVNSCDYQATQQGYLKRHIQLVHDKIKYLRNLCDHRVTKPEHPEIHIQSLHENINAKLEVGQTYVHHRHTSVQVCRHWSMVDIRLSIILGQTYVHHGHLAVKA